MFSFAQEIALRPITILQVLGQIFLHASELADALLKSIDILFFETIEVLAILFKALVNDLSSRLGK